LDLAVPRIANTVVQLTGELKTALLEGMIGSPDDLRVGPLERLTLHRPRNAATSSAGDLEAEQLVLWKVRPGSVVAEAKLRLRPQTSPLQELEIDFDSRLQVLPPSGTLPLVRSWIDQRAGTSTLHVALAKPVDSETTIPLSFLWPRVTGTGALELPSIRLRAGRLKRDWAAIQLGGGLAWKTPPVARPGDPSPAEFAAVWGNSGLSAVVFDRELPMLPALVVEVARARTQAHEQIDCSVSLRSVQVRSRIRLEATEHAFAHRLRASGGLRITKISVHGEDGEVPSHWNQADDGTVAVQLVEPVGTPLQIDVEGQATPTRLPGRLNLPLVQYQGAATSDTTLRVHRAPDVQLTFGPPTAGWKPIDDPNHGRHQAGMGRLSAVLTRSGTAGPARLQITVSENMPVLDGLVVARLTPADSSWSLEIEAGLQIAAGQLDALRLDLPAAAVGPVEISPAVEHELLALAGQTAKRLVVRPQRAVTGPLGMRIRVPLAAGADLAAIAPLIALPDAPGVRRVVALPRRSKAQAFDWETSGLQAIDPVAEGVPGALLPAGHDVFEAVAPRASATVQLRSDAPIAPRVVLASHALQVAGGRQITGTTTLDVLPGGARQFTLAIPPNLRLIHVSCAGIPAQLRRRGGGTWTVTAASSRLPQRVEVIYAGSLPRNSQLRKVDVLPWLVGAEVERTSGTLSSNKAPLTAGETADRAAHEWQVTQLEGLAVALEELSTASAGDHSAAVLQASLSQWQERFDFAQVFFELPNTHADRAAAAGRLAQLARERMAEAGILPTASTRELSPVSASVARTSHWVGPLPEFIFEATTAEPATTQSAERLIVAAAYITLAVSIALVMLLPSWWSWLARHAHFVLAAAAVVWLAAGPIPWVAVAIVPLALWLAIRSPWPRASADLGSSLLRRPERSARTGP
jgi:hypothetical protein